MYFPICSGRSFIYFYLYNYAWFVLWTPSILLLAADNQVSLEQNSRNSVVNTGNLNFSHTFMDLGSQKATGIIRHEFKFTVSGNVPVRILEIQPSCGCVRTKLPKQEFLPSESGSFTLAIHTTSQKSGEHTYQLLVRTEEKGQRFEFPLVLKVVLFTDLLVEPSNLRAFIPGTLPILERICIRDSRPQPLQISNFSTSSPLLQLQSLPALSKSGDYWFELTIQPGFSIGEHQEWLIFKTNDADYQQIDIPVFVIHPAPIRVAPDTLNIHRQRLRQKTLVYRLLVQHRGGEPLTIGHVESPLAQVQFHVDSPRSDGSCIVLVTFPAELAENNFDFPHQGKLKLEITRPMPTTIFVPFTIQ